MKKSISIFFYLLILISPSVFASPSYPDLAKCIDGDLQINLKKSLKKLGLSRPASNKKLALTLVDITDEENPKVASVNGTEMMYAASLPKIAILLGAFERIESGTMKLDKNNRDLMTRMIRNSSNQAATTMLNKVGKKYLSKLLQSPRYKLYDKSKNGGLWVGKEYGRGAAFQRDPLHNISHGATAMQVARYYYFLETNRLVSAKLTKDMKEILSKPAINHKFVKGLKSKHPDSKIFRKSGSWRQFHADSAIVERDGRRYIAVALAENPKGGQWLSQIIVEMDKLIFSDQIASTSMPVLAGLSDSVY
jgi:beta-lactamase class A